jgi:hypothetical protein
LPAALIVGIDNVIAAMAATDRQCLEISDMPIARQKPQKRPAMKCTARVNKGCGKSRRF